MKRRRAALAARSRGRGLAREVTLPLPLKGLFARAATAEVQNSFAARMDNLRSTGVSLELVPLYETDADAEYVRRRVPFEFGSSPQYISLKDTISEAGSASTDRVFAEGTHVGYVSEQALLVDGAGQPVRFDGSTFTASEFTTDTGVDPADFDGVLIHHDRPYFWRYGQGLDFYYGDIGAVTGPLTRFPLGRLGNITGRIAAALSLTQDASENLNDSLCILTTTGQIVIYEGTNPGDASDWRLAGRVQAAPPVSQFGFTRVGGDIWMITSSGLVSVLDSLRQGVMALVGNLARPIAKQVDDLVKSGGEWQLHSSANGRFIIVNHYMDGASRQFIYDVEGRSWETATYPARRWHNLDGRTEFTTDAGVLGRIEPDTDGEPVTASLHTGWFRLRRGTAITAIQPTILARGPLTVSLAVLSDHDTTEADVAEATQTVTLYPDDPADPNGTVSLDEMIAIDAVGSVFQLRLDVTAIEAEIVAMTAFVA